MSFSIFHRKWKIEMGIHFRFFIFHLRWKNTKWATEKATKTTTHNLVLWHYC